MKTVAIIAPQFIPCSYPPTQRVIFFANHLENMGWKPVVFCVKQEYMEEPPDWEFMKIVPDDLEVIKIKALPAFWTRKIGIGDIGIRCFIYMLKAVRKLCRQRKIDLLFIPGPPWYTFLIGPIIKREFGIPYVMDYIDPWISSMGEGYSVWTKAYWYRKVAILLEPGAIRNVDHVISVSEGTNDGVMKWNSCLKPEQCTAIPYGGEPADFEYLKLNPRPNPYWDSKDGNFHMVYVGAMFPRAFGNLRTLFSAILKLQSENHDVIKNFRIHFFGTTYEPNPRRGLVIPVAEEMGVEKYVTEHPKRVPYLDAANILCQADAIFCMGTSERHYTASKIFPCLLSGTPLFSVVVAWFGAYHGYVVVSYFFACGVECALVCVSGCVCDWAAGVVGFGSDVEVV